MNPEKHGVQDSKKGSAGCVTRLVWMLGGSFGLLFSAAAIIQRGVALSFVDAIFWAIAGVCVAARYLDIAYLGGETASGEPATLAHWRRYVGFLALFAGAVWLAAHAFAYLLK